MGLPTCPGPILPTRRTKKSTICFKKPKTTTTGADADGRRKVRKGKDYRAAAAAVIAEIQLIAILAVK